MLKRAGTMVLCTAAVLSTAAAQESSTPTGIPHLDHVFVIMMENHGFNQILHNRYAPFINKYAKTANLATNYFAIAHPSLTNYLEVTGGSNFGVLNDNPPDWHNASCTPNIVSGVASRETTSAAICPISGTGTDAATPAIDYSNETTGAPGDINIDGTKSIPADSKILGKTIADQLVERTLTWKSYQESLPPEGADGINNADGFFSNKTDFATALPGEGVTAKQLVALYAVKHNPFAYFASVQQGSDSNLSLVQTSAFDGPHGLWSDLRRGRIPSYAFIAPNQCNDMHGRGNAGPVCEYDPQSTGTQVGLNPGLIRQGDYTVENIVGAIHDSSAWKESRSAIILVWDENDYSVAPITNKVMTIVDTNYGVHGIQSNNFYDHFSLLKSVEAGLGLPCLNHACDSNVSVMSDLFAEGNHSSEADDNDDDIQ